MTNNFKILIIIGGVLFLALMVVLVTRTIATKRKAGELIKSELSGILIEVKDLKRGSIALIIKQHQTNKIFEYHLQLSKFVRENAIKSNDSLSKTANSNIITFYKKNEGAYKKCCELTYY